MFKRSEKIFRTFRWICFAAVAFLFPPSILSIPAFAQNQITDPGETLQELSQSNLRELRPELEFPPDILTAGQASPPPMDNGELDRPDRPFDYFSRPTAVLGTLHGRYGFEVAPEGGLYTGYHEVGFFAGEHLAPVNQRVKTLEKGYLPIVNVEFSLEGVDYRIQYFAVQDKEEGPMAAYARMTASNPGNRAVAARFGAGVRYGLDLPNRVQKHMNDPEQRMLHGFNPKWKYAVGVKATTREGKSVFSYDAPPGEAFLKKGQPFKEPGKAERVQHAPADWMALAVWRARLAPGASKTVRFVIPFEPAGPKAVEKWNPAEYESRLQKTIAGWDAWLESGARLSVPEAKVNETFKANLIYMAIAMDRIGDAYVQKVNEFQYDSFWIRDASFMLTAFGELGFPFEAKMGSLHFLKYQTKEGNFESQRGQLDGFGQSLWTFGRYYELTRDREYLKTVWPAAWRAVQWLNEAREKEKKRVGEGGLGYGMMHVSNPGDNEMVDGHVVGHDIWALHGLEYLRRIAPNIATAEESAALEATVRDYRHWLDVNLNEVALRTGGFITPALEPGGFDWANLKLIWPTKVLAPFDPRVTETLRMARYKFKEGIMTYDDGKALHHYIGIDVPQSELTRGEQTLALKDFYALVAHTSSTHGGFEWSIKPWGDRDFGRNLAPHGCFAGKWLLLYRNMLVREEDGDLHLGSALSPHWLRPGEKIEVKNAPTSFGPVSYAIEAREDGATVTLEPPARIKPERTLLHLPDGFRIVSARSEFGTPGIRDDNSLVLPPDARRIDLTWERREAADVTFNSTVKKYLHSYWLLHPSNSRKGALLPQN